VQTPEYGKESFETIIFGEYVDISFTTAFQSFDMKLVRNVNCVY
jgi:hypothetical protein